MPGITHMSWSRPTVATSMPRIRRLFHDAEPGRDISAEVSAFFAKQVLDRTFVLGQMTRRRQNSNCCSHKFLFSVARCGVAHRGRVQASAVLRCGKKIVNYRKQKLHLRSLPTRGHLADREVKICWTKFDAPNRMPK